MKKWTIILIAIIILLIILIVVFSSYGSIPEASTYSQMEVQMRKLWY